MRKILLSVLILITIVPFVSVAQTSDRTLLQSLWNQLLQLQTIVAQLMAKQKISPQPIPANTAPATSWQTYRFNTGDFPGMSYLAFEIKYPASWSYKKMSGNVEYIAFYPKAIQNELEVGAMITNAPIVLNMSENNMTGAVSNNSQKHKNFVTSNGEIRAYLGLANSKYQKEFDEMAKSFVFKDIKKSTPINSIPDSQTIVNKLRVCPTNKITDQMPTVIPNDNPPSTYFILNGQRRELSEFDLDWVSKNCSIKNEVVY